MVIGAMLHSKRALGLFSRCIMLSGGTRNILTQDDAEKIGAIFAAKLPDYATAPVERLLKAQSAFIGEYPLRRYGILPFQPCFGELICSDICHSGLEILIGVCHAECSLFLPQTSVCNALYPHHASTLAYFLRCMGIRERASISELVNLLPAAMPSYAKVTAVLSALFQEGPLVLSCKDLASHGNRVCAVRNLLAPSHVGELPYIFGTWDQDLKTRWLAGLPFYMTREKRKRAVLQQKIWMDLIGSFSQCGCGALPFETTASQALYVNPEGVSVGPLVGDFEAAIAATIRTSTRPFSVRIPRAKL
eukprot:gnl/MRDRNA2_/MRDRNA2_230902_c0_seq1.p1 gnl/MRDRNA2_/MRDRNA2_230902_c0~~gnl/MRDRNA2_/MRDRNA2_230902_c0_seq1.p1  ORF type:complete len:305 (+),score=43.83 gnl/MRDRNA2_/MRDRNA2_230902_c0_seq1:114-1028(+)